MATQNKVRHLYYDQQKPSEEPIDPAKASITQEVFSRNVPTLEDEYFYEEEQKRLHPKRHETVVVASDNPSEVPKTKFWHWLSRALTRRFDTSWKP